MGGAHGYPFLLARCRARRFSIQAAVVHSVRAGADHAFCLLGLMFSLLFRSSRPFLLVSLLVGLAAAAPAQADWSSTSSAQVILRVDPASGSATAVGASYAIQGSGLGAIPALNSGVAPAAGLVLAPISDGAAFQVNMAYKPGDSVPATLTPGTLPAFSEVTVQQPGDAGGLAGEVSSPIRGSASPGGPGTTATLTQSNTFSVFR